jgi:hypothetical protein
MNDLTSIKALNDLRAIRGRPQVYDAQAKTIRDQGTNEPSTSRFLPTREAAENFCKEHGSSLV